MHLHSRRKSGQANDARHEPFIVVASNTGSILPTLSDLHMIGCDVAKLPWLVDAGLKHEGRSTGMLLPVYKNNLPFLT